MKQYDFLIIGNYGVPNWGDEAILSGMLQMMEKDPLFEYLKTIPSRVVVASANPKFTKKQHRVDSVCFPPFGIRSLFSFRWGSFFRALYKSKAVIIGGGGLFQPRPWRALWIWGYYLFLSLVFQKPVYIVGNSFEEPQKSGIIIPILRFLFSRVSVFIVRDHSSKKILEQFWRVDAAKIHYAQDMAFFMQIPPIKTEKKIVLMMREGDLTQDQENALQEHITMRYPDMPIHVLVMQHEQSHDERYALRHGLSYNNPKSLEEVIHTVSSAALVVSSRLHGNILAKNSRVPFIAIAPRAKIAAMFEGNCLLPSDLNTSKATQFFESITPKLPQ